MKRLLIFALTLCVMLYALCVPVAFAVGTVVLTSEQFIVDNRYTRVIITLTWTADVATATVPNTAINASNYGIKGWYLYSAETNPGDTAPTDNYDIVINDADGLDIALGLLNNRHTSNTQLVNLFNATIVYPIVRGNLTFVLSNNAVNSATGTCILIFIAN